MRVSETAAKRVTQTVVLMAMAALLAPAALAEGTNGEELLAQGRSGLQRGDHAGAAGHLRAALETTSLGDQERGTAQFLLGVALRRAGEDAAAVPALEAALTAAKSGVYATSLADELHFELANALAATGAIDAALKHFEAVMGASRSPHRADAALRKARLLGASGKSARKALKAYEYYVETWPAAPRSRDARLEWAKLLMANKSESKARRHLERLVAEAPQSRAGLVAALQLKKLGATEPSRFQRLLLLEATLGERRFAEAIEPLERLRADSAAAKDRAVERDTVKLLVRALSETRREKEALEMLPALRRLGGTLPSVDRRMMWTALSGDFEGAERMVLKRHKFKKNDWYWRRLGNLRFSFGRYEGAFKAFKRAHGAKTKKVDGQEVEDLTPKMAWALIGMGKPKRALWYMRRRNPRGRRNKQGARYWLGRAHQLSGNTQAALASFDALADAAPYEYYGILAHSRALEMRGDAPGLTAVAEGIGPLLLGPDNEAGSLKPSGTILWTPASLDAKFDQAPRPQPRSTQLAALENLAQKWGALLPEVRRSLEYAQLGFRDKAIAELRVVNSDLRSVRRKGPYSLLKRGRNDLLDNRRAAAARGGARLSAGKRKQKNKSAWIIKRNRREIRNDLRAAQVGLGDPYGLRRQAFESGRIPRKAEDIGLWRRIYPVAFPNLVSLFSDHHRVPPYFLYGIMTVESTFHPCAVSVANAYGLLQVIPRTGRRIADSLGYSEFSPELLLEPEVSIYFGSYYLGALLRKFRGQELLAAAAYNAGPHRVDRWLRQNPNRNMDLFVEQIPYGQTRGYARSVLEKVARYRRTYHGEERVYVSNRLASESSLQPNY